MIKHRWQMEYNHSTSQAQQSHNLPSRDTPPEMHTLMEMISPMAIDHEDMPHCGLGKRERETGLDLPPRKVLQRQQL